MSFARRVFKPSPLPLIFVFTLLQFGCGDDSTGPVDVTSPQPISEFWQGTYESADHSQDGAFLLDLVRTGSAVKGQIMLRDRGTSDTQRHLFLSGTSEGDSLLLGLDYDSHSYQFTFNFVGEVAGDSTSFTGNLSLPIAGLAASVQAEKQVLGELAVDSSEEIDHDIHGLAVAGDHLWMSTLGSSYLGMTFAGVVDDTISVLLENYALWTSVGLATNGTSFWGTCPVTVSDGTDVHNVADLIEFGYDGMINQRVRVPMRVPGLAYEGSALWTLGPDSEALYRLDGSGSVVETVPISVPDLIYLEYDGEYFWSVGWFLTNLYQIDRTGKTVAVYHLPDEVLGPFPGGLAFDGSKFWYSASLSYLRVPGSLLSSFHVVE